MGRGATKWEGEGHVKFYLYEKVRGGGGRHKFCSFNMGALSFSHAEGGHNKFYPVLGGGGG